MSAGVPIFASVPKDNFSKEGKGTRGCTLIHIVLFA